MPPYLAVEMLAVADYWPAVLHTFPPSLAFVLLGLLAV